MADKASAGAGSATAASAPSGETADPAELTKFVENLLEQMNLRFKAMSDTILTRIDEMGERIVELEKSISELAAQSASDGAGASTAAAHAAK